MITAFTFTDASRKGLTDGRDIVPNRRPTRGAGVECARRGRDKLPDDVLALLDHRLLDLGGIYGDSSAGAESG